MDAEIDFEAIVPAQQALAELGKYPIDVANTLRSLGIKGRHDCVTCPIAVYLNRRTGQDNWRVSGTGYVWQMTGDGDTSSRLLMPPGVERFVECFDDNVYFDLWEGAMS